MRNKGRLNMRGLILKEGHLLKMSYGGAHVACMKCGRGMGGASLAGRTLLDEWTQRCISWDEAIEKARKRIADVLKEQRDWIRFLRRLSRSKPKKV